LMTTCSVRRWGASTAETTSRPDRDRRRASRTVAKSPPMGSIVSRASRGGFGAPESRGLGRSDLPNRLRRITDTQWVASSLCSLEIEGAATDRPSRDFPGSKGSRRLRPDQRPRRRWRDRRGKMLDSGPISDGHREPVLLQVDLLRDVRGDLAGGGCSRGRKVLRIKSQNYYERIVATRTVIITVRKIIRLSEFI